MIEVRDKDHGVLGLVWPVLAVGLVLTVLAPFVVAHEHAHRSVAIGAVLAAGNLAAIGLVVRGVMRGALLSWGSLASVKFMLLLGAVWLVLKNHWAGPVPLALGYAALPLGIVIGQLLRPTPVRQG
ncbi:MAG TPA: hypothetical protein VNN72_08115 [Polyangiaceae bacterium]|nr:hypothetical protein [Polyangiaceae bacterium]